MHKLNLFDTIKFWGQEQRLVYAGKVNAPQEQPIEITQQGIDALPDLEEKKGLIRDNIIRAGKILAEIPQAAQTQENTTLQEQLLALRNQLINVQEDQLLQIIQSYNQLLAQFNQLQPAIAERMADIGVLRKEITELAESKKEYGNVFKEIPGLETEYDELVAEITQQTTAPDFSYDKALLLLKEVMDFQDKLEQGKKLVEAYKQVWAEGKDLDTRQAPIDIPGWVAIPGGVGIIGGPIALAVTEGIAHGIAYVVSPTERDEARHLYAGIGTALRVAHGADRGTAFGRFNSGVISAEDETSVAGLTTGEITEQLSGLDEGDKKEIEKKVPDELYTMAKGYLLGLMALGKKDLTPEESGQYKDYVLETYTDCRGEMVTHFKKIAEEKGFIEACQGALLFIASNIKTPQLWKEEKARDQAANEEAKRQIDEARKATPEPAPGDTAGGGAGDTGLAAGPATGPAAAGEKGKEVPLEKIDSSTYAYNKKAMDKWKRVHKDMEAAIKKIVGYDGIDYASDDFAKKVQVFQASKGVELDKRDGKIGPQTMTAIIEKAVAAGHLPGPASQYFGSGKGKVEKRLADYYTKIGVVGGGKRGGKGKKGGEKEKGREAEEKDPLEELGKKLEADTKEILKEFEGKEIPKERREEKQKAIVEKVKAIYGDKIDPASVTVTIGDLNGEQQPITIKFKLTNKEKTDKTAIFIWEIKKEEAQQEKREEAAVTGVPQTPEGREFAGRIASIIGTDRGKPNIEAEKPGSVEAIAGAITKQLSVYIVQKLREKYDYFDYKGAKFQQIMQKHEQIATAYLKATLQRATPLTPQALGNAIARGFEDKVGGGGDWFNAIESQVENKRPKLTKEQVYAAITARMTENGFTAEGTAQENKEALLGAISNYIVENLRASNALSADNSYKPDLTLIRAYLEGADTNVNKANQIAVAVHGLLADKKTEHPWI